MNDAIVQGDYIMLSSMSGSINFGSGSSIYATITSANPRYQYTQFREMTMEDLKSHAAFKTSITALEDLWRAKYGNEWVDIYRIKQDEFYEVAAVRLAAVGRLEKHCLINPHAEVFKLVD